MLQGYKGYTYYIPVSIFPSHVKLGDVCRILIGVSVVISPVAAVMKKILKKSNNSLGNIKGSS